MLFFPEKLSVSSVWNSDFLEKLSFSDKLVGICSFWTFFASWMTSFFHSRSIWFAKRILATEGLEIFGCTNIPRIFAVFSPVIWNRRISPVGYSCPFMGMIGKDCPKEACTKSLDPFFSQRSMSDVRSESLIISTSESFVPDDFLIMCANTISPVRYCCQDLWARSRTKKVFHSERKRILLLSKRSFPRRDFPFWGINRDWVRLGLLWGVFRFTRVDYNSCGGVLRVLLLRAHQHAIR